MGGRGNKSVQSDSIHFLILLTRTPPPSRLHAIREQRSFFENEPLSRVHRFCLHTVLHVACTGQMHPNETGQQQFRDTSLKFRFSPTIETLPIYFFKVPINNKTIEQPFLKYPVILFYFSQNEMFHFMQNALL